MDFVNGEGGGAGRKALIVLTVEVKAILACFAMFLLKLGIK